MESENYILKYYELSKCRLNNHLLFIRVRLSIYNQYYNAFLNIATGHKKSHVAEKLCHLYFFIHFNSLAENSKLSREELQYISDCNNPVQVTKYRDMLVNSRALEYSWKTYTSNKGNTIRERCTYSINEQERLLDFTSSGFKELMYQIPDSLIKSTKKVLKYYKNILSSTTNNTIPILLVSYSQQSDCDSTGYVRKCYRLEEQLELYSNLRRVDLLGNIIESETHKLNKPAKLADDHRIYHYFHSLPADVRTAQIVFDNDYLTECFDVHNASFCFLYCLLDNTVKQTEKNRFYNLVMSGKFYEDVQQWVNSTYKTSWDREYAKTNANAYMNLSSTKIENALKAKKSRHIARLCVYKYFEENYPTIHKFICNNKDNLHNRINVAETSVMFNICKTLYENYGVKALTLHDAIYIRRCDTQVLKYNNITTEQLFKENIDYYNFIEKFN